MTLEPSMCRFEAFQLFVDQLDDLESVEGLCRAAVAIAWHAMPDIDPAHVEDELRTLGDRVESRVRTRNVDAMLAQLHFEMFDVAGYQGNQTNYYDPLNSYLPSVVATGCGIPITLALVYKVVAHQVGLIVDGLNAPGHFLVQVHDGERRMIVDPFFRGQLLTREEAFARLEQISGRHLPRDDRMMSIATHRMWLARILANLQNIFARTGRVNDLAAMSELLSLLV